MEQGLDKLREQVQHTEERTDSLEARFEELSRLMTIFMGRYKK
ncbi:MAG: hypothetical protein V7K62_19185 [Nostoc sp.]